MKNIRKMNSLPAKWLAGIFFIGICAGCSSKEQEQDKTIVITPAAFKYVSEMQNLWESHIVWTRNVILCLVDSLPGTEQAINRLLQNQVDIGNAFKPYYGEASGNKLTELLNAHINISAAVIAASKAGFTPGINLATNKWYNNADEISEFLSKSNPFWPMADLKMMMHNHLKLTMEEVIARIQKDYDGDALACDKIQVEILQMSDMLASGIFKQFPEKFKATGLLGAVK